jgi:nucleoside-diphosphate-sugar epimerase
MAKLFFIGGSGNISRYTVRALAGEHRIAVFNRGESKVELPANVRHFSGNRKDATQLESAIRAFGPDVVLDFIGYETEEAQQAIAICRGRVAQFVFVSTVDVYGFPLKTIPARESDAWNAAASDYARKKQDMETLFMAHHSDALPVTIVRPTCSVGTWLLPLGTAWCWAMIQRIREGRPVLVPDDGTNLMQCGHASDTGRMIAKVVLSPGSFGEVYNVGGETWTTQDEYYRAIGKVVGREPNIVHIPSDLLLSTQNPAITKSRIADVARFHLAFSMEKFQSYFPDFQWEFSLEQTVRRVIEDAQARGEFADLPQNTLDDEIIEIWQKCAQEFVAKVHSQ